MQRIGIRVAVERDVMRDDHRRQRPVFLERDEVRGLESETAHFQLADPGSPTMVKDDGDEGALYVLMPMRV